MLSQASHLARILASPRSTTAHGTSEVRRAHWHALTRSSAVRLASICFGYADDGRTAVENRVEVESLHWIKNPSGRLKDAASCTREKSCWRSDAREAARRALAPIATFNPTTHKKVFHRRRDRVQRAEGQAHGVLGAGASAFDNAGEALEAGAAEAVMFARRPILPQVNKSKWTAFPGFQNGYASLDDARRWRFYTYIFSEQVPPPYESILRCERHAGFSVRFGEGWDDILPGPLVKTRKGEHRFDAVIVATGFDVNLVDRAEIAPFRDAIETWRSHVSAEEAQSFRGVRFRISRCVPAARRRPGLGRVHVFNWGSTIATAARRRHPGLDIGARRLAQGIARDLFLENADRHYENLLAHNETNLSRPATSSIYRRADRLDHRSPPRSVGLYRGRNCSGSRSAGCCRVVQPLAHGRRLQGGLHGGSPVHDLRIESPRSEEPTNVALVAARRLRDRRNVRHGGHAFAVVTPSSARGRPSTASSPSALS